MSYKKKSKRQCLHIISEPNDGTHYDYFMIQIAPNLYSFATGLSPFPFPSRLDYFDCKRFSHDFERMSCEAEEQGCNVFTLSECMRSVIEHWEYNNGDEKEAVTL